MGGHEHVQPFPRDLLETLSGLAGEFATGRIPEPVKDAVLRGNKLHGPRTRRDIAWAIAYIDAAKRGEIQDHHHNKTVGQQYGVSTTTVTNWVTGRDKICEGLDLSGSPEEIEKRMRRMGEIYRKATGREPRPRERKEKGSSIAPTRSVKEDVEEAFRAVGFPSPPKP